MAYIHMNAWTVLKSLMMKTYLKGVHVSVLENTNVSGKKVTYMLLMFEICLK